MMPCPMPSGGQAAPLLVSLAFGYAALILAKRETKSLNLLGRVIGWTIIAVSAIGLICIAACGLYRMCPKNRAACDSAMSCPYAGARTACAVPEQSPAIDEPGDMKK